MSLFKFNDDSLLVSLDIGSYALRCAVFRKKEQIPLELISFKEVKTSGMEESRVTHFEEIISTLDEILSSSEDSCKSSFSEIWLGFSPSFYSFHSQGMAALISREVTKQDRDLAVETACAVPLPEGHICLHKNPEFFSVDGKEGVLNPLGLSGLRMETEVHLVSIPQFYCQDIIKALKTLGYSPKAFFHNLVAFGQHFTSFQQKRKGICVCDIGYKSTRLIAYHKGKALAMISIPIGGDHFTEALANQFHIPKEEAEYLKETKGNLLIQTFDQEEASLEVSNGSLYLSRKLFSQTLEKAAEKLLQKIKESLDHYKLLDQMSSGFLFTGSTAYLPGFTELAGFHLGGPVSHPTNKYENFKQTNNFTLIEQAYLENKLNRPKQNLPYKRWAWRELF